MRSHQLGRGGGGRHQVDEDLEQTAGGLPHDRVRVVSHAA